LAGQTIDLKEFMDEEFLGQFFESTRRQFTAEGKQFAIGWMAQTFGFFYNPPLFETASAAIPETWDDLMAEADKIRTTEMIPWVFNEADKWLGADYFLPLITQVTDDPELVYALDDHTQADVSWNSEPVIEALSLIDRLVKAEVFQEGVNGTDWSQATGIFYSGNSAMFFAGSWVPQGIKTDAPPEFAESYRIFPTPAWAPGKRHWCGNQAGAALAVSAHGHIDESLEFIRFLYEPDRYSLTMNNSLSMPSTSTAAETVEDPIMKEMTSWLVDGAPHILFGKGSWDAVGNGVQAVFGQLMTPEAAAEQIEADVVAARAR
jgi:ABC-type glycerol-3-phosphate transport system substrate-binding protein